MVETATHHARRPRHRQLNLQPGLFSDRTSLPLNLQQAWHVPEFMKGVVIRLFPFHFHDVPSFRTFEFRISNLFRISYLSNLGWHVPEFSKGVVISLFASHFHDVPSFRTFVFRICQTPRGRRQTRSSEL